MEQAVELLLVEDNPSDAELTLHLLKKHNFSSRVKLVRDGAEALDYIFADPPGAPAPRRNFPKLILLDLKLPKVNGLELLSKIKSDPSTKTIPVVILTSSREDRDLTMCYELGANSYLVKPVDFTQFSEAVRHFAHYWLRLNQHPRPMIEPSAA